MRKLHSLSEEHRDYLLKTYDLVGISTRINRYLTMRRKDETIVQHGDECKVMYQQLRRGYYQELHSLFGTFSFLSLYMGLRRRVS